MNSQKNQSKKSKTNKKVFQKAVIVSAASVLLASPITPLFQNGHFIGFQEQTAQAALADVSILNNTQLVSNTGTNLSPNGAGNYDLDLTYSGDALASVGLGTPKVVVFALPTELQGKVVGGATVAIDAKLLPITPAQLPGLPVLIGTADAALTTLDNAANLAGQGTALDPVIAAFQAIKTAQNFGNYQETLPGVVSPDGKYISVNFTDGLGNYVKQLLKGLFDALHNAINAVAFTGLAGATLNPLLATLKNALNPIFTVVDGLLNLTGSALNNLISASLLAGTSYNVKFAVSPPGTAQSKITAGAINTSLISAGILGDIQSEGASVTLNFANPAWTAYTITPPTINPVHVGDTSLTGTVALASPIPAGSTFSTVVTLPDGSTATAVVNLDGSFIVPFGSYTPKTNDSLSTVIEGLNGGVTKTSTPVTTTVLANTSPGWDTYVVAPPVIDSVHAGDTEITGKTTLTTPIPTGTTFTTIITLANGTEVTATINPDGTFTVPLGANAVTEGEILSSIVQGANAGETKNSTPVLTTVLATLPDPAWAGYVITPPVVEPVSVGDTEITGKVTLTTPIPNGSTFTAIVTLKDGTKVNATVNPDGTFTVPLGSNTLTAGDILSTTIQGVNGGVIKNSTPVESTVLAEGWEDYVVSSPVVNSVYVGDTTVTGTVALATPIPAGTTFEAIVTLPDGTKVTATVNPDGTFTAPLGSYTPKEGDTLSTIVEATNNGEMKDSAPVVTTIKPISESPAWLNYVVAAPVLNPIHVGDTTLTGNVTLNTPIPEGTTFSTVVTLPDNTKLNAIIAPDGSITVALNGYVPKLGDTLSTIVEAKNGTATKDSTPFSSVVQATLPDPAWAGYTVAAPIIDSIHAGDTEITGKVTLAAPIPPGSSFTTLVTLPNGNVVQAPVNPDGTFTVALGSNTVSEGDVLSTIVQGINGGVIKNSTVVESTVLAPVVDPAWGAYVIASPVVEPVSVGDTEITGKVTLETPIPNGSIFTAIVTLKDGTKVNTTVNPDGTFTVPLGSNTLTAGDILSTTIQGVNGGVIKNSTPVESTVLAAGWKDYVVSTPVVNPIYVGDTTVTGTVALATPIPAGTTFEAIVTLPDGTKVTATVNPDGTFTAPLGSYTPKEGDTISTIIEATNNGETKDSTPVVTTIKPVSESPAWLNYVVAAPMINPVHVGDTTITGTVLLNTPIPAGTTFSTIITLANGTKITAAINPDGTFTASLGSNTITEGDALSSIVEAVNGTATKNSTPVLTTVLAALPDPAWAGYVIAAPVIEPISVGDTTITGKVTLTTPIPNGSTFTAIVTLKDGTKVNATVNPDGTFTVPLGSNTLTAGDILSTTIQGINGGVIKNSTPVESTVLAEGWKDYVVSTPVVNPVYVDDTTVTGTVALATPIPAGTTFEAIVTLPDGTKVTATVNPDGTFTAPLGSYTPKEGDTISTIIEATNNGEIKDSTPVVTTIKPVSESPAWLNYVVAAPVLNPVHVGDTTLTGNVTLNTPIPAGTTFSTIITLPDNTKLNAVVAPDGSITVALNGYTPKLGDSLSTIVQATNGVATKDSTPVVSVVQATLPDPAWAAYTVAPPVIDAIHAGDTAITGKVTLTTPIPAGSSFTTLVTLPNGNVVQAPVNPDGTFTVALGSNLVAEGDVVSTIVQGINGGVTKDSPVVETTVLAALPDPAWGAYVIASPVVEPVSVGDTAIKGKVTLTTPIPNGSTFTAIVTLKDGTKVNAVVNPDGTFTVPLGSNILTAGDILSTTIQGLNGGVIKNSDPVESTVLAAGWKDYVVSTPVVNPIYVGDTAVTGTVALATPIPAGTTFEAIVTLPDGTKVTATVNPDGTFTAPLGSYTPKEGDTISTIIEATNNGEIKDSTPVVTTIKPASESPAWLNYVVAAPVLNPVHVGDTTLTGNVTLNTPIPTGTTFKVVVTLPDGSKVNAIVGVDGNISVSLGSYTAVAGDTLSSVVEATNGTATKLSTPVTSIVQTALPDPAWAAYTVAPPVVSPVHEGDTTITGKVTLTTPIPNGSSFTALVTLPNGTVIQAQVNPDGTFTVALGDNILKEGDSLSTIVQGINGGVTKDSTPVTSIVEPSTSETEWNNYVITAPTINQVHEEDLILTGSETFPTPVPAGATFVAVVTLADGSTIEVPVSTTDGVISIPFGAKKVKKNDILSIVIRGTKAGVKKESLPTSTTVLASAWEDYVVSSPVIDPIHAGDKTITGSVTLNQPVPADTSFTAIVTLPDGTVITAPVDSNGHISVDLGDNDLTSGDVTIVVEATHGGETKESTPVTSTILPNEAWDAYVITKPVINAIHVGDKFVTGKVTLNTPIPAGTVFTAIITLPDGSTIEGSVAEDGTFKAALTPVTRAILSNYVLKVGDQVTALIEGVNGGEVKEGPSASTIVLAVDTNNPGTPVTPGKPGSGTGTTPGKPGNLGTSGTTNGGKYTTTKVNGKGSKGYKNGDSYPQTGEQNNSLFSYLGFLTLGSAALLFLRKKFAKK